VLTVPQPTLSQEGTAGNWLTVQKPIKVACGPVRFPDGTAVGTENVVQCGFSLYRERTVGTVEVWDKTGKVWTTLGSAPERETLFFMEDKWQSVIVAVGQKDRANQNKFGTDPLTRFPNYFVRCSFVAKDVQGSEHTGESTNSQAVEIVDPSEQKRAGLSMEPMDPADAREIRLFLKDAALVDEQGKIVIKEDGGGFLIELKSSGAMLAINKDGEITLNPRPGQAVRIEGDVHVNGNVKAFNIP
jgi:hypothetical protein